MEEALKRLATPEARQIADEERRRNLDRASDITRARQRKLEMVDAKLRAAQALEEAKGLKAVKEIAIREERKQAASRQRFLEDLGNDWGRRLGHYKGARPMYDGQSEWGDLDPEELLKVAREKRPALPGTWVTDFSDWIFGLEHPKRDPAWLAIGKTVEKHLLWRPANRAKAWLRSVPL